MVTSRDSLLPLLASLTGYPSGEGLPLLIRKARSSYNLSASKRIVKSSSGVHEVLLTSKATLSSRNSGMLTREYNDDWVVRDADIVAVVNCVV